MTSSDRPFETIEDTQAFLAMLSDKIDEIVAEAARELSLHRFERRHAQAWQVVIYKATKLSSHIANSRRIMNELRAVRKTLNGIAGVHTETPPTPAKSPSIRQGEPAPGRRRNEPCVA